MMKIIRPVFLVACLGLLAGTMLWERHPVYPLSDGDARVLPGEQFVEGTTTDSYLLQGGKLYDVRSLLPPEMANQKDCKT